MNAQNKIIYHAVVYQYLYLFLTQVLKEKSWKAEYTEAEYVKNCHLLDRILWRIYTFCK